MTLRELHVRLGQMIADREGAGMGATNDLPVVIRVHRGARKRVRERFYPVAYAGGAIALRGTVFGAEISARESEEVRHERTDDVGTVRP